MIEFCVKTQEHWWEYLLTLTLKGSSFYCGIIILVLNKFNAFMS